MIGAASAFGGDQHPNILFLFADDQRADTIAALGNPNIQTPSLDRLVRSGLAFNRAYMQGGLNGATCVPSRAMLLSGKTLFRIDEKLMRDETWPAAFGRAGYTTFMSGKWHNGESSIPKSFQIARSIFAGGMANPMKANLSDLIDGKLGPPHAIGKHACATFADETIRFLKEHRGAPFFCYVPFDAPHDPHIVPDDFPIHYDPANIPLPPNFLPQHPWDNGEMLIRDEQLLPWPRTPEKVRAFIAEYYRYISYLDSQIGRVMDALAASPYATNTIVVFSADSGVARGSHGLIGKQNLYELDSIRVPLIVSGPGIPAGRRTDAMCYLFDVLPTLGKICGVSAPATSEGIEFTSTLNDPAQPARSEMLFAYQRVQRAARDDRWKLIRYPLVNKTQLFDLQSDPFEITNLAEKPQLAAKVAELMALLARQQKEFGDTAPLTVENPKPAAWSPPPAKKSLPLPGDIFLVQDHTAFTILPQPKSTNSPIPWVWYAPTLPGLPGNEEKWMFERFTQAGIAIAGIDVGESYGSPDGRALYSALHDELTKHRGFAPKAVMLGRSRGGLMTLCWAVENADKVAGFAGIYPVCNIASYPGVANASGAYHMTAEQLRAHLAEHNPIDRLAALTKAGVPLFAIQGDSDMTVPLEANSAEMRKRYEALGGKMQLIIPPGQGHNMWTGFFQCQELVDFVIAQAKQANVSNMQKP